jgi:hypothetical protein
VSRELEHMGLRRRRVTGGPSLEGLCHVHPSTRAHDGMQACHLIAYLPRLTLLL